jgi:endo-1,3-1,4-beta-glycanase ExoK
MHSCQDCFVCILAGVYMPTASRIGAVTSYFVRALACAAATSAYPAPGGDPTELQGESFFETFEHLNSRAWLISDGWSNGDYQGCTWSKTKVRIESGRLALTLERIPSGEPVYQCGEIQSRAFFGYGTFEARLRVARAPGIDQGFFTYVGPIHGRPHDEIDFEVLGRNTREVQLNTYVAGKGGREQVVQSGTDSADEFVDYAFEWTPDRVRWFVDGKLIHEISGRGENVPTHAAKIYLGIWNGHGLDNWLGRFEGPREPLKMFVEHVAFTAVGHPCQFPSSIVCGQRSPGSQ